MKDNKNEKIIAVLKNTRLLPSRLSTYTHLTIPLVVAKIMLLIETNKKGDHE